jgi:hypothetical protein
MRLAVSGSAEHEKWLGTSWTGLLQVASAKEQGYDTNHDTKTLDHVMAGGPSCPARGSRVRGHAFQRAMATSIFCGAHEYFSPSEGIRRNRYQVPPRVSV